MIPFRRTGMYVLITAMLLPAVPSRLVAGTGTTPPCEASYDAVTDHLSIKAEHASLHSLLAWISMVTGIEILMAPQAQRPVDVRIENKPADEALRLLARTADLNYAMVYGVGRPEESASLVMVKFLARGQRGEDLIRVLGAGKEPFPRSLATADPASPRTAKPIRDLAAERRQLRLATMPPEERSVIEAKAAAMAAEAAARKQKRDSRKEAREARRTERDNRRQMREETRRAADPQAYEERLKRREENRQALVEIHQQTQPKPAPPVGP